MQHILRPYTQEDLKEVLDLFYETVHSINARDYTTAQLAVWAPETLDVARWENSLGQNYTVVAECKGQITGFGDIDNTGYLDHLFVHKDFQGEGVATLITNALETYAESRGFNVITVAASITAKPFFEKHGYEVNRKQHAERHGQVLVNFQMKKQMEITAI